MIRYRESTLEDYDGIEAAIRRSGLSMVSREEYQHRWSRNPFTPAHFAGKTGWVMETEEDRIVGWMGNIHSGYELNGRPLLAACTHALAVDAEFRTQSLPLVSRFFRQAGVDLLLNTTANETAEKVCMAFKARHVPHPTYDRVLYWIVRPGGFLAAALRRKRVPLAGAIGGMLGPAFQAKNRVTGGIARVEDRGSPPFFLSDFDERFEAFWQRLRLRQDRLLAVRSAAALKWHFHDALRNKRLAIVAIEDHDGLLGYAVLIRRDAESIHLRRYVMADLQVIRDDAALVRRLFAGAVNAARKHGVHVLEVTGLDAFKHGIIAELKPRVRQSPSWPYLYKAQSVELAGTLESPDAWDPCPYDGDAAF